MKFPATHAAVLCGAAVVLAACGSGSASPSTAGSSASTDATVLADGEAVHVVATTSIWGDVVAQIGGADVELEVLMGPGVDPHAFAASAAQAQSLREADLVVANGLNLEESLLDALDAAEDDGANVIHVAEELDPIEFGKEDGPAHEDDHDDDGGEDETHEDDHEGDDASTHEDGHDHGALDPHVWMDPQRMATGATIVAGALAGADDSLDDAEWEARGQAYADELLALDQDVADTVAVVPEDGREMVTNHDSFEYFAQRHDFEVIGTVIPGASTQVDTSAESFVDLAELIRDRDVPAIFTETTSDDRLAEALAEEVGRPIEIVRLYSGSLGEPGSGAETYVDMMRFNAGAIADALG